MSMLAAWLLATSMAPASTSPQEGVAAKASAFVSADLRGSLWKEDLPLALGVDLILGLRSGGEPGLFGQLECGVLRPPQMRLGVWEVDPLAFDLRAMIGLAPKLGEAPLWEEPMWRGEFALGLGPEIVRARIYDAGTLEPVLPESPVAVNAIMMSTASVGFRVEGRPSRNRFVFRFGLRIDADFSGLRYQAINSNLIAEPLRVRPGAYIGIGWLRRPPKPPPPV